MQKQESKEMTVNDVYGKLGELLKQTSRKIIIISHVNPDGDAIGSVLAFSHFLKKLGFNNHNVVLPNAFPSFLEWMPGSNDIIIATEKGHLSRKLIKEAEIIFCLDFNHFDRSDQLASHLHKSDAMKVLIDHHPNPATEHFDYLISQISTSSTAQLVYDLIVKTGYNHLVNKDIAECIYAGIVTDTGSFSFACNFPDTYYIVAELLKTGIDGEKIHRLIYDTYSVDRMRLLGYCLSEKLKVMLDQRTAYIYLDQKDLRKFDYKDGDTEGVVNYALSIKGVSLAAIFIERQEQIKVSFRSEGEINVNLLARKYFNGGGHKNAAGGNSKDTLQNAIIFFENIIHRIAQDNFNLLQ